MRLAKPLKRHLMPNPPSMQPNLLPTWQPSLQPNLQLESPFLWPLLSMCSSLRRNAHVKRSGTPSLLLIRPDIHPYTRWPGHFVVHMPLCSLSSFVLRVFCLVIGGAREPSLGVGSLGVAREPSAAAACRTRGAEEVGKSVEERFPPCPLLIVIGDNTLILRGFRANGRSPLLKGLGGGGNRSAQRVKLSNFR